LQEHHRPIEHVYFIERGVASLLARTRRDGPVEVAIVGRFGFIGVAAVLGTMRSPNRCLMEVPGEALRINTNDIRCVMEEAPLVRQHLLNYVTRFLFKIHKRPCATFVTNLRNDCADGCFLPPIV
jgi:CRP-like cAMP-binding protein